LQPRSLRGCAHRPASHADAHSRVRPRDAAVGPALDDDGNPRAAGEAIRFGCLRVYDRGARRAAAKRAVECGGASTARGGAGATVEGGRLPFVSVVAGSPGQRTSGLKKKSDV